MFVCLPVALVVATVWPPEFTIAISLTFFVYYTLVLRTVLHRFGDSELRSYSSGKFHRVLDIVLLDLVSPNFLCIQHIEPYLKRRRILVCQVTSSE